MQTELWGTFLATASRRALQPALALRGREVSFAELRELALRAAAFLSERGVRRGDVVSLQLTKRAETYALILGCLRLGAIYVCIDPKNPADRTQRIVARVEPKLLLAEVEPLETGPSTTVIDCRGEFSADNWPAALPETNPADPSNGGSPAYLMFTSGSTGEPKGAVMPHIGILSLMQWGRQLFGDVDGHRFTAINPLHFDNSIFDFYCGLISGATLVPVETSAFTSPADWLRLVNDGRASVLFAVPTLFTLLDKAGSLTPQALPHVRHFLFGGEGFPIETLRAFHQRFLGHARLTNVYGPTETSCICSSLPIDEAALADAGSGFVSLGRMHVNFEHAVLDPDGKSVSKGEPGELWIGGPCVGLGYYRQPEETARRFRQDPRQSEYRSIFYRTGDLVREDEAGKLWFVGRADNQVKIAGHRIELEEIDFALQAHANVRRAVTVVAGSGDDRELVAVFEADRPIDAAELSAWCRTRLPSYMQPRRFEPLAELPRNANGKVDRLKSLALASIAAVPQADKAQPQSDDLEGALRQIWAGVLNLAQVPADANFFDLGGTSLLMIRVHTEIKRLLNREVSTNDLFAHPKIADLVRFLEGGPERNEAVETAQSRGARQRELMQRMRKAASSVS